jgi:predicted acylesterase/phospholipase RssA
VLQGGGALGAYEAGVFNVLYHWIKKDVEGIEKNIFDIIAGTSIGAINAAILVSHVKQKGSWEGAPQQLLNFWKYISSTPILSRWLSEYYTNYNNPSSNETNILASTEALRRYYSAKEFTYTGAQNVFLSPTMRYDFKFFDNFSVPVNNIWVTYDNTPLRESIRNHAVFPIATSFDEDNLKKQEPRLLLVSVDAEEGEAVTFESYNSLLSVFNVLGSFSVKTNWQITCLESPIKRII